MVTLRDVIDIRTGKHHSIAIVKEKNARYFVSTDTMESEEEE